LPKLQFGARKSIAGPVNDNLSIVHFLARCARKKTNHKKAPVPRFFLRVAASNGSRGNSPDFRRGGTVRAPYPFDTPMPGAGQRDFEENPI
jgi:hypothetical protein